MIFSREYLNYTQKSKEETQVVVQRLVDALSNNETLTLSEGRFVGGFLGIAQSDDEDGLASINKLYQMLPDYHFWRLYLLYCFDVNGEGLVRDAYGPIPVEQRLIDSAFLEAQYQHWKPIIYKLNHKYTALQFLTKESRDDIKEALKYAVQLGDGSRRRAMIEKTLVLHSKYVFSKIKEYYQEYDVMQDIVTVCGWEIVVDSFAYAHVAIRHMAPWTKFGRPGKTYHSASAISIDHLPRIIIGFLKEFERNVERMYFNPHRIFFKFKERNYVIRFEQLSRKIKGGQEIQYLRVRTFYPAEIKNDDTLLSGMSYIPVNEMIGFYR